MGRGDPFDPKGSVCVERCGVEGVVRGGWIRKCPLLDDLVRSVWIGETNAKKVTLCRVRKKIRPRSTKRAIFGEVCFFIPSEGDGGCLAQVAAETRDGVLA